MVAGILCCETGRRNLTLHSMAGGRISHATELPLSFESWFSLFHRIKALPRIEATSIYHMIKKGTQRVGVTKRCLPTIDVTVGPAITATVTDSTSTTLAITEL